MSALDLDAEVRGWRTKLVRCAARLLDASYGEHVPSDMANAWREVAADAADAEKALITRLRAAEARTAWQPIETAPRGEWVEVWGTLFRCDEPGHHIARLDSWGWGDRAGIMIEPTHYRRLGPAHLPAAPEAP